MLGPNGSGKTTLFELITGSNTPSEGRVLVDGRDIHRVRYRERDRLAIHYHQSYQVRVVPQDAARRGCMERAGRTRPLVHLFDEPQFSIQDGYIGFMLDFFRAPARERPRGVRLRAPERAVPPRGAARVVRALRLRAPGEHCRVPRLRALASGDAGGARLPGRARAGRVVASRAAVGNMRGEPARFPMPLELALRRLDWGSLYVASEWIVRIAALIYVPQRRPPSAARAWLLLIFFLPWPGVVLYLLIGRAYMPRRRLRVQQQIYELIRRLAPRAASFESTIAHAGLARARAGAAARQPACPSSR